MRKLKESIMTAAVGGLLFVGACLGTAPWRIVPADTDFSAETLYWHGGGLSHADTSLLSAGAPNTPAG
jgi:hypothetical protein